MSCVLFPVVSPISFPTKAHHMYHRVPSLTASATESGFCCALSAGFRVDMVCSVFAVQLKVRSKRADPFLCYQYIWCISG